ncbi:hypothetical protein [Pseudoduganella albidiflava]|uniref:Lysozyme n=1 Tax=Pseudoduganella albidiflava TaxID=321983 RepID=A0A411X2Q7_9BURK|nr:hypothetical protein [Pseudoduganella albidiflava]QBI03280.1 hypothetical protein EYF70_22465 [Pseudoduganella albidiflava]GGY68132.1 hypothetical protein GCM10007387_57900 [Pseudoduganella albidiflava]
MIPAELVSILFRAGAAIAVFLAALATGYVAGRSAEQGEHLAAEFERANAEHEAITKRLKDNAAAAARQAATNESITKGKNDEVQPVIARIAAAERVRVGSAICGGSAGASTPEVPSSGDGADSSRRMVRSDVDRDLKALMIAVEKDLATGRACQAAAREHGLAY